MNTKYDSISTFELHFVVSPNYDHDAQTLNQTAKCELYTQATNVRAVLCEA